jgi:hypothetical protein
MIKTFEQFVADKYGKPVNEAYQSSKLREIINQHGKPKYSWELKLLHDLKDDEIIDVVDSRDEYWKKYPNEPQSPTEKEQATFMLELQDGACVVISNLDIFKSYFDEFGIKADKKKEELFKKRHSERHVGNLGRGGELDIRKTHRENVNKLMVKRLIEKSQPNIDELVDVVRSLWDNIDTSELCEDGNINSEIRFGNEEYNIYIDYSCRTSDIVRKYGAEYYDLYYNLKCFEIEDEDGTIISNEDLNITPKTHKDLFEEHIEKDVEGGIYDYYDYYGVSRSDFF